MHRRTQCANNLKQIGIATHNHHDVNKVLPSAGFEWPSIPTYRNGVPLIAPDQDAGWAFQILPYMEQLNVHAGGTASSDRDKAVFATGVPHAVYNCPSRHGTPDAANHNKGANTRFINFSVTPPVRQTIPGATNIMRGGIDYGGSTTDTLTVDLRINNSTVRIVSSSNMGHGPFVRTDGLNTTGGVPNRTVIGLEGVIDGRRM